MHLRLIGNIQTYTFEIDKTPPVAIFSATPTITDNTLVFSRTTYITWTDKSVSAFLLTDTDDIKIDKNYNLKTSGIYNIKLLDKANNVTLYHILIVLPTDKIEFITEENGIESVEELQNNKTYIFKNAVSFTIPEGYSAFLNGKPINDNNIYFEAGSSSELCLVDAAENEFKIQIKVEADTIENNSILSGVDILLIIIASIIFIFIIILIIKSLTSKKMKFKR